MSTETTSAQRMLYDHMVNTNEDRAASALASLRGLLDNAGRRLDSDDPVTRSILVSVADRIVSEALALKGAAEQLDALRMVNGAIRDADPEGDQ